MLATDQDSTKIEQHLKDLEEQGFHVWRTENIYETLDRLEE